MDNLIGTVALEKNREGIKANTAPVEENRKIGTRASDIQDAIQRTNGCTTTSTPFLGLIRDLGVVEPDDDPLSCLADEQPTGDTGKERRPPRRPLVADVDPRLEVRKKRTAICVAASALCSFSSHLVYAHRKT